MLVDVERLQAILKDLSNEVSRPAHLPDSTREMLEVSKQREREREREREGGL